MLLGAVLGLVLSGREATAQSCTGDCDGDEAVVVNELVTCVSIALERTAIGECPACDANADGRVTIDELTLAVGSALRACPASPTVTPEVPNTPTATASTPCPLEPGTYTVTSLSGGRLKVGSFAEFPFPAGGTIVADVGPGNAECVHRAVVPYPSPVGFTAPVFCIYGLGLTTRVQQTGCGIGRIDSDTGSDYSVLELGDTSDTAVCHNAPDVCPAGGPSPDNAIRVRIRVGDDQADVCTGTGHANAIFSIPVETTTWQELSSGEYCGIVDFTRPCTGDGECVGQRCLDGFCENGADGTLDEGRGDALVNRFPQILDFTTDVTVARFEDLDGDGCVKSGIGGAFSRVGSCLDVGGINGAAAAVTLAAAGTVGSNASPWDLTFATVLPNRVDGPEPPLGAVCASPPAIEFGGSADRCIDMAP